MTGWPDMILGMAAAALGGAGVMVAGYFKARADNNKIRSDDRVNFTQQVMDRVAHLEKAAVEEREYCEQRLAFQSKILNDRLEQRDKIITELRGRISELENKLDGLLK